MIQRMKIGRMKIERLNNLVNNILIAIRALRNPFIHPIFIRSIFIYPAAQRLSHAPSIVMERAIKPFNSLRGTMASIMPWASRNSDR